MFTLYDRRQEDDFRFVLGDPGENPLFVFGVNPSTAKKEESDLTISKVIKFSKKNRFDGFVMLNIYPQRTPNPNRLHTQIDNAIHLRNLRQIDSIFKKYKNVSILAAWGNSITKRPYLMKCINDIVNHINTPSVEWKTISLTKLGHPRHPSRAAYKDLIPFDIKSYLKNEILKLQPTLVC